MMRKAEEGPVADTGCAPTTTGRSEHSRERDQSATSAPRGSIAADLFAVQAAILAEEARLAARRAEDHASRWYARRRERRGR